MRELANTIFELIKVGLMLTALSLVSYEVHAAVTIEEPKAPSLFRVEGKPASPVEATEAASRGSKVQKCTAIKDAITSDGKPAFRCKFVQLVINPLSGTTKWKNL